MLRTLMIIIAVMAVPATAAADPPVGGFLSIQEAISFQKKFFPPQGPFLLRDKRATFFHTKLPIAINDCARNSRSSVTCRFILKLIPDRKHRKANWFPIRCDGKVRARHRTDGSNVGDVRNYKCRTV